MLEPYPNQIVVPPLRVQGSMNGTDWTELGTLVPPTAPTIVDSSTSAELTLGPATFWWENPIGQPAYEHIRVGFGPGGPALGSSDAGGPGAPSRDHQRLRPAIARTSRPGMATPIDSGDRQAPLGVQVLEATSSRWPTSAEYQSNFPRIYYRNGSAPTDPLITNLFLDGVDPSTFIGVSPCPGAYPNNGSVTGGQCGPSDVFNYVSTTSTVSRQTIGWLAKTGRQRRRACRSRCTHKRSTR